MAYEVTTLGELVPAAPPAPPDARALVVAALVLGGLVVWFVVRR